MQTIRLGAHPLEALSASIGGDVAELSRAVVTLLGQHPPAQRLLLVIDQFEELFTLASRADQGAFVAALRALDEAERWLESADAADLGYSLHSPPKVNSLTPRQPPCFSRTKRCCAIATPSASRHCATASTWFPGMRTR